MANLHTLFEIFHNNISICPSKKQKMMTSKNAIRKLIKETFEELHSEYKPYFYIQGSYKHGSSTRTEDDWCDLDDGVYFLCTPDVTPTTLQKWILEAVDGHTSFKVEHRKKCIRVIFSAKYHIDIPVYYLAPGDEHPYLAVKNEGWIKSDPKEFVEWLKGKKDKKGQLVRIIKYLKAWCDYQSFKMPSGLCMSVLAANHICYNKRDDLALLNTLKAIQEEVDDQKFLGAYWQCKMPTTPKDDLFEKYTETVKKNFLQALDDLIEDGEEAISTKSEEEAVDLWAENLGTRFPEIEIKEKLESLRQNSQIISSGIAYTSSDFKVGVQSIGVKNQPHQFFRSAGHALPKAEHINAIEQYSLIRQKIFLIASFPAFQCIIKGNKLICKAIIKPLNFYQSYQIRIEYQAGYTPKVFIEDPLIEYNSEIHVHADNSLCLHHPSDLDWKLPTKISEWIVPWIVEWLVFYELWKLTGKWEGREYIH
ncbi:cyclic GMP-AMP synthase DncV-like nucleotidyltransferase [Xanthocytophaga agilis]|uniref:Cyclic GMP-AMP synthase n=1 Tax=Xanthocytophaga agilis TaxID=3048010 RepID=A0AAE3RDQ7_9BACT|nr:hypothetical protein [Xanthocytophaga agilis]MDJ1506077.1 hypothetical protein [Xanthocytophaga agilis]